MLQWGGVIGLWHRVIDEVCMRYEEIVRGVYNVHFALDFVLSPPNEWWVRSQGHEAELASLYKERDVLLRWLKGYRR